MPCKPGDTGESDGKDEAICPCDMNIIIDNDLRTIFQVRGIMYVCLALLRSYGGIGSSVGRFRWISLAA